MFFVASRLGRRPKRLKEMQLAASAVGNGASSVDLHRDTSSAAMRRICMSSSIFNSSVDVADVHVQVGPHSIFQLFVVSLIITFVVQL